jgi:hypothetical protein
MNTPSEVGGVLARIAEGLPRTLDAEGYRRLFTQAANHLLPLAHPPNDLRHAINSRRDARSSINDSRERRHENEIHRREEYDRDHGIPARSQATRTESATASTGGTTRERSRNHNNYSPPWDRHHPRWQEDTCGVSALTPRLRAIQWPPNFKVSNVDKYEPKQDPGGLASRLHHRCSSYRSVRGRDDRILTHCPWARRAAMAATSTPTLHRRLGRLQSTHHRQFPVPLRQAGATVGSQIHQVSGRQNSPVVPQKVLDHEKPYPRGHGGGRDRRLLPGLQ